MDELRSITFDGKEVKISKELIRSFQFLGDIEKELKTMIFIEEDIRDLEIKYGRLLLYVSQVIEILEKNKIPNFLTQDLINDFEEDKIKARVDFLRSKMIALFSAMQTIFCLVAIYDNDLTKESEIKKKTQDDFGKLIEKFILNDKNEYYLENKKRFQVITSTDLVNMRNRLTHFFSVDPEIMIIGNNKHIDLLNTNDEFAILSPYDLYHLVVSCMKIILADWNDDCLNNKISFNRKIKYIEDIVGNKGAIILSSQIKKDPTGAVLQ